MPWKLDSVILTWPPQATLKRAPGERETLHPLFVFLEDKRLLRYGYGPRAGITTLVDLRDRVDDIRSALFGALAALAPEAPIAEWLRQLQEVANELLTKAHDAASQQAALPPEPAEIVPAVNELRVAFAYVAEHVFAEYELPAARNLADQIRSDIQ